MVFTDEQVVQVFNAFAENDMVITLGGSRGFSSTKPGTYEDYFPGIGRRTLEEILENLYERQWINKNNFFDGCMYSLDESWAIADDSISVDFSDPGSLRALGRTTVASQVPLPFSKINQEIVDVDASKFRTKPFTKQLLAEWTNAIVLHMNILENIQNTIGDIVGDEVKNGLITSMTGIQSNIQVELQALAELRSEVFKRIEKVVKSKLTERAESQEILDNIRENLKAITTSFELAITINGGNKIAVKIPNIRYYKRVFAKIGNDDWMKFYPKVLKIEGTGYEGRNNRIEYVNVGDILILKADYKNEFYEPVAIEVFNARNETLGYLAETEFLGELSEIASHIDKIKARVKDVTPLSKRSSRAKYALMNVELYVDGSTLSHSNKDTDKATSIYKSSFKTEEKAAGNKVARLTKDDLLSSNRIKKGQQSLYHFYDMSTLRRINQLTNELSQLQKTIENLADEHRKNIWELGSLKSKTLNITTIDKVRDIIAKVYNYIDEKYTLAGKSAVISAKFCNKHKIPYSKEAFALVQNEITQCALVISNLVSDISALIKTFSEKDPENELLIELYNCLLESVKYTRFEFTAGNIIFSGIAEAVTDVFSAMPTPQIVQLASETAEEKTTRLEKKKEEKYLEACECSTKSYSVSLKKAVQLFKELGDYKDSKLLLEKCQQRIFDQQKEEMYIDACDESKNKSSEIRLKRAIQLFKELGDYKDSARLLNECNLWLIEAGNEKIYKNALEMLNNSNNKDSLKSAQQLFSKLGGYKDSKDKHANVTDMIKQLEKRESDYAGYQNAVKAYKTDLLEYDKNIDKQVKKEISKLRKEKEKALNANHIVELNELEEKKARLKAERSENEKILSSLGLFKGKEKKMCRDNIERLTAEIKQVDEKIYRCKVVYADNLAQIQDIVEKETDNIRAKVIAKSPKPVKPVMPEHLKKYYKEL